MLFPWQKHYCRICKAAFCTATNCTHVSGIYISSFFLCIENEQFSHFLFIIPKSKTTFMLVPWCSKITSSEPYILGFSKYSLDSDPLDLQNLLQAEMKLILWFLLVLLLKFKGFVQPLPWEKEMEIKYYHHIVNQQEIHIWLLFMPFKNCTPILQSTKLLLSETSHSLHSIGT